jgi:hypothetical protein
MNFYIFFLCDFEKRVLPQNMMSAAPLSPNYIVKAECPLLASTFQRFQSSFTMTVPRVAKVERVSLLCPCRALRRNNKHFVRRTNVCEKQERPSTWSGGPSPLFFEIEKLVAHVRASPVSGGMDGCGYITVVALQHSDSTTLFLSFSSSRK